MQSSKPPPPSSSGNNSTSNLTLPPNSPPPTQVYLDPPAPFNPLPYQEYQTNLTVHPTLIHNVSSSGPASVTFNMNNETVVNDLAPVCFFEFLDESSDYLSDSSTAICMDMPPRFDDAVTTTSNGDTPLPTIMNPFAFYGDGQESPETSSIASMDTPSPLPYDLRMDLMSEQIASVSEATREFATAFICDPRTSANASISPDSLSGSLPNSPVMDGPVCYSSKLYSPPGLPMITLQQEMSMYGLLTTHDNNSTSIKAESNPKSSVMRKSRSLSRTRRGPTVVPETDANCLKVFTCEIPNCDKTFKRLEHLKRHVRSVHTQEKPFECPDRSCRKRFARSDNLNQHIRTHL